MAEVKKLRIIFITLVAIDSINDQNLYADLMRFFVKKGHYVSIISPGERRTNIKTSLNKEKDHQILRVRTFNIQKTNILEKTISTFRIDSWIKKAMVKYFEGEHFDVAIYSTPPITLTNSIEYLKSKYKLKTYLLLKDIFPQNAVDIGLIKKGSWVYNLFRRKEKLLYQLSDTIGCMSEANKVYLLNHNPELPKKKVVVCPNSIEVRINIDSEEKEIDISESLGIPNEATVFIYGGNLGKPQGINFLINLLDEQKENKKAFFIIVGSGTEYATIKRWYEKEKPPNVILESLLPKDKYEEFVRVSDVGMIFLDHRFTIPNYPSRLLSYLEFKKPILAFTDGISDIGRNAEQNNYGKWSDSENVDKASKVINFYCECNEEKVKEMGAAGYKYLVDNYSVRQSYEIIMNRLSEPAMNEIKEKE